MSEERGLIEQHEQLLAKQASTKARVAELAAEKKIMQEAHDQMMKTMATAKQDAVQFFHDDRKALIKDVERKIWQLVAILVNLLKARI
jgi:mevalonate kinase